MVVTFVPDSINDLEEEVFGGTGGLIKNKRESHMKRSGLFVVSLSGVSHTV